MKKAIIVIVPLLIIVAAGVVWMGMPRGPALETMVHLKAPRITVKAPMKVLLVTVKGDPNKTVGKAFGLLMKTYFSLNEVPKSGPDFPAPRARWPLPVETPKDQWIGLYAMPVPDSIVQLPQTGEKEGATVELATWEYGAVAEILHVGPYSAETPTVEKLKSFIEKQGYEIAGDHEEEYVKGPGMLFKGDPENYLTIIRYPVMKMQKTQE